MIDLLIMKKTKSLPKLSELQEELTNLLNI